MGVVYLQQVREERAAKRNQEFTNQDQLDWECVQDPDRCNNRQDFGFFIAIVLLLPPGVALWWFLLWLGGLV